MKCKIAFFPKVLFLFWLHMEVSVEHIIFLYNFFFFFFETPCFVNPSFKPICFKDQAGPST